MALSGKDADVVKILGAFGLDDKKVVSFRLDMAADSLVVVEVVYLLERSDLDTKVLEAVMKRYHLEEIK